MSMTMQDRRRRELEKEQRENRHRLAELQRKIDSKVHEGTSITKSVPIFEQCYKVFCDKA